MQEPENKVLSVVGPTASGKTALSLWLAGALGGEIICCDSMQIYRGMDIGTAKVTEEEKQGIPHYMLDVCEPSVSFSAADYAEMAGGIAENILQRGKLPIFCGGTGLYLEAVRTGRHGTPMPVDAAYRASLIAYAEKEGNAALHTLLREKDPASAERIHPNNRVRVVRALEMLRQSGKTKTELDAATKELPPRFRMGMLCLVYHDRELLYRRIEKRVDEMFRAGLWAETKRLYSSGLLEEGSTAAQAIGYKQVIAAIKEGRSQEEAANAVKLATRHYAKRQLTWFLAKDPILLYADEAGKMKKPEVLFSEAYEAATRFLKEG